MLSQYTRKSPISLVLSFALVASIANACSSDDDDSASGRGGTSSSGGKTSGGTTAKGGSAAGGTSHTGGTAPQAGAGGASQTGGAGPGGTGAGGTPAGGVTGEGGAATTGGQIGAAGGGGEGGASTIEMYVAALTGGQEVSDPAITTTAVGAGAFEYDPATRSLKYTVTHNVADASAAHIHDAAAGENGPVIIPFASVDPTITGSATLTETQESDLRLGHLYANVHSTAHPGGEIRGQILRAGESLWVARLAGSQENPPVTSTGTGTVSLIVNAAHSSAHYRLTTSLTATAAHIHTGIAGVSGGVHFPFTLASTNNSAEGDVAFTSGDFTVLASGGFYANVHTTASPGGEIRGQLVVPGERVYAASLSGASEVPAVTSAATGNVQFILNTDSTPVLRYQSVVMGFDTGDHNPTASHIHAGDVGVSGAVVYPLTLVSGAPAGTQAVTATDIDQLNGSHYYVNIHTTANPGGEIRGQILPL